MESVLRHAGWLLIPEPREEQRGSVSALAFFLLGILLTVAGIYLLLVAGRLSVALFLGLMWDAQAALYAVPPCQRRIVLLLRVALTLAFLALAVSLLLTWPRPLDATSFPVWLAVSMVLAVLCVSYLVNRRRAYLSRSAAS